MPKHPGSSIGAYLYGQKSRRKMPAGTDRQRDVPAPASDIEASSGRSRRDAPVIWLHVDSGPEALGVPDLIDRLRDERDDVSVLVTTARPAPDELLASRLPRDVVVQHAPNGTGSAAAAFLDRWRPDVCIWADANLEPTLITAADKAGIPLFLVDARVPERSGWRWLPGPRKSALRRFRHVIAGDARSAAGFRALGVPADRIEAMGFLQEGSAPLTCSQAERDSVAEVLAARPVWLAAAVTDDEVPIVVGAHQQAIRRAHRLLLILAPNRVEQGAELAARLEADGWITALRSRDDDPGPEVEVFVADLPDELGLWYRLSPISLMGGTLAGAPRRPVQNPYEAAALGSAVLFGPHTGLWRESYERLREAGAARAVSDRASLARAVEFLLAPDKVAAMAAAAWEVTTSGAEATDRIVALVIAALDERGV